MVWSPPAVGRPMVNKGLKTEPMEKAREDWLKFWKQRQTKDFKKKTVITGKLRQENRDTA